MINDNNQQQQQLFLKCIHTGWSVQLYIFLPQGPVEIWEYTKMHAHIAYNKNI